MVLKYATWLKTNHAVAPREIVAMDFTNSPNFIFIWLAIWSLGATPAFINYNLTGNALVHCIETSTARIVFVDEEVKHKFMSDVTNALSSSEGNGPVQVVYLDPETENHILESNLTQQPNTSRSGAKVSDMALLIYTSGTTGLSVNISMLLHFQSSQLTHSLFRPKAGIVSWNKLYSGHSILTNWMGWEQQDRFYTVSKRLIGKTLYLLANIKLSVCLSIMVLLQSSDLPLVWVLVQHS